jgi:hypothetical protein
MGAQTCGRLVKASGWMLDEGGEHERGDSGVGDDAVAGAAFPVVVATSPKIAGLWPVM